MRFGVRFSVFISVVTFYASESRKPVAEKKPFYSPTAGTGGARGGTSQTSAWVKEPNRSKAGVSMCRFFRPAVGMPIAKSSVS